MMKNTVSFRVLPLVAAAAVAASGLPFAAVAADGPAKVAKAAPAKAKAMDSLPVQVREVEGVHEYRLPNGLQVLLIPDASKPTVTVNVTYRVGSRYEGYGETGMAHLLEHLMFRSTKTMANVSTELSKRGMQFNGSTTADRTNYFETFPADPAQLAWALRTEAERMTHANVIKKDLDSEMTVVRNEMESGENNPFRILMEKTNAAAFQWHAYGKDTIGARSGSHTADPSRSSSTRPTLPLHPSGAVLVYAQVTPAPPSRAAASTSSRYIALSTLRTEYSRRKDAAAEASRPARSIASSGTIPDPPAMSCTGASPPGRHTK